ncbi:MAG: hypothetical protein M0C28_20865 [Candidatus Moduliflexus flocculans]|nr:hypothetical protein [Candidatus Moduliflexus flocculans]
MEFLRYHRDVLGQAVPASPTSSSTGGWPRSGSTCSSATRTRTGTSPTTTSLREFLNAQVGEPRFNNVVWRDRAYAERGEKLGTAVTSGSLTLSSEWVYQGTGLRLSLSGENSEVLFAAEINDLKAKNPASF